MVFNMKKIIRDLLTILCFCIYIFLIFYSFYHSLKSSDKSSISSGNFSTFIKNAFFIFNFDNLNIDIFQNFIRKLFGHFGLFFLIGLFGFLFYNLKFKRIKISIILSVIIGFFISIFSEVLQLFASGRNSSFYDVVVNFSGLFSAIIFMLIIHLFCRDYFSKNTFIFINIISVLISVFYAFFAYKSKSLLACFLLFFITYLIYLFVNFTTLKSKTRWK